MSHHTWNAAAEALDPANLAGFNQLGPSLAKISFAVAPAAVMSTNMASADAFARSAVDPSKTPPDCFISFHAVPSQIANFFVSVSYIIRPASLEVTVG